MPDPQPPMTDATAVWLTCIALIHSKNPPCVDISTDYMQTARQVVDQYRPTFAAFGIEIIPGPFNPHSPHTRNTLERLIIAIRDASDARN